MPDNSPEEKTGVITHADAANAQPPQVPDYDLLRCIGHGAYGEVWLAKNVMGTFRAIKIVYRTTFKDHGPFEREFNGIRRFETVSGTHPGLLNVLHVGRNDAAGYFYYAMEVADDEVFGQSIDPHKYKPRTLSSEIIRRGRLPLDECIKLGLSLTIALEHLHRYGLVHRDIKPANIIFAKGAPKLADIGLVTEIGKGTLVFTPGYNPPEGPGKPNADVFSLGRALYVISTGKQAEDFPELHTGLNTREIETGFLEFNNILLKACACDPNERYQSAEEMRAALSQAQAVVNRAAAEVLPPFNQAGPAGQPRLVPVPQPTSAAAAQLLSARVSRARHDLRNPLSDILGFGQILQEETLAAGHLHLIPDFQTVQEAATHIFAEVNHCLNLDTIKSEPESLVKLRRTIHIYSEKIIALTERLSEKCDTLENNSFGDDLLRITGSARQLQTLAPALLDSLTKAESSPVPAIDSGTSSPLSQEANRESPLLPAIAAKQPIAGTVLVVDDNEADRAVLSRRLRRQGHTVSLAENGRQALEKLRARGFDLVLLDIVMPEMDGFEVLRRLKADAATQNIPVIMLSAMDEMDAVVRCIEMGADDYLPKPFPPTLLTARVRACLSNKRLTDQLRKYTEWLFGKTLFRQAVAAPGSLHLSRQERTILFADIRGFTHWSECHPPEEAVTMLNRYFEASERIWKNSSVIKTEYTGDEIMGVFPAARDAVLIAQALRLEIGRLLGELGLGIGVGLHTGLVIEGLLGGADVKAYRFVGDTVNTARRICTEAQPGQVLLSEFTFVQVASAVVTGPVFELSAKGKAEPVKIRPLLELAATPA